LHDNHNLFLWWHQLGDRLDEGATIRMFARSDDINIPLIRARGKYEDHDMVIEMYLNPKKNHDTTKTITV